MPGNIPLIGVMAHRRTKANLLFAEAGYFARFINAGKKLGLHVFVFSPLEIDWHNKRVVGFTPQKSYKQWQKDIYPFPDVVYDRLFPGKKDINAISWRNAKRLRESGYVLWLNRSLHGKWDVYQTLASSKRLKPYLPETVVFDSQDSLLEMLYKYKTVFIKPNMGTQGKGVMGLQIGVGPSVKYKGRSRGSKAVYGIATSLDELMGIVRPFMGDRRYLVQQGLSLRIFNKAPCDVRVVVQKGYDGNWDITGHAVRVGPTEGVISNLHGGGTAIKLSEVLERNGESESQKAFIISEIEDLALNVAKELDKSSGGFAEFGMDIGLDVRKRVWLIEVNSKPGRKVFLHTGDMQARQQSILNPLYYSCYLLSHNRTRESNQIGR